MKGIEQYLQIDTSSPTGLRWIRTVSSRVRAGDVAFSSINRGYYRGKFQGKLLLAHRVVWHLAHGEVPEFLDHVSGDRLDNRLENLRPATKLENAGNRVDRGTRQLPSSRLWEARIFSNGKSYRLGTFASEEAAHQAYLKAKPKYHPTSAQRAEQEAA